MNLKKENKLFAVVGPTASGKTSLAIAIAKHFNTSIISCDSRQFYKEMAIGTAVPSAEELLAVQHHFIQSISIQDEYNVGQFEKDAILLLSNEFNSKNYMLMCGGSGLYETALTKGLNEFPTVDDSIKNELLKRVEVEGVVNLAEELKEVDFLTYDKIDTQNSSRVVRALSIYLKSGKPMSYFQSKSLKPRNFNTIKIGIQWERQELYDRINKRVDFMIESGLVEEARSLYSFKHINALNTIGYKELFKHFDGIFTLEEAIIEIKKNTRRFAKRQLTWYRKDSEVKWFKPNELDKVIPYLENF